MKPLNFAWRTVPASFTITQRQAAKDAVIIFNLNFLQIINKSSAAALAYGWENQMHKRGARNALIFNFGDGTLDVSIVRMDKNSNQVKSITGDSYLGGDDFDNILVNHFATDCFGEHLDSDQLYRLRAASENVQRMFCQYSWKRQKFVRNVPKCTLSMIIQVQNMMNDSTMIIYVLVHYYLRSWYCVFDSLFQYENA